MRNRCAKSKTVKREKKRKIQKCFVYPKEENKVVDRRKCTPPLSIRALLCIKLMVKKKYIATTDSMWCPFAVNVLLRIPFITIQRYVTYFFIV